MSPVLTLYLLIVTASFKVGNFLSVFQEGVVLFIFIFFVLSTK